MKNISDNTDRHNDLDILDHTLRFYLSASSDDEMEASLAALDSRIDSVMSGARKARFSIMANSSLALSLLYQSLRALLKPAIPNRLVKPVFELKLMELNGEYMEKPLGNLSQSAFYTWEYVLASPPETLYTFTLTPEVLDEFIRSVENNKRRFIDKTFHSLDILHLLVDNVE